MARAKSEDDERARVIEVADRLARRFGPAPPIAVVLGSGLGGLVDAIGAPVRAPYGELGLPASTVPGHAGELVVGTIGAVRVAACAGRVHLYEGRPAAEVVRATRALARWGVQALLCTNAVGGIAPGLAAGSVVIVTDHLNLQGTSPLVGAPFGTRFPDLSRAYDPELRALLAAAAARVGVVTQEGVLAAMLGPSYETPAEIRMLARLGADVVGMSTVPEVLAAAEVGLRCAVLSLVANRAAGLTAAPLTHAEVVEVTRRAGHQVVQLICEALPDIVGALAQEKT